MLSCMWCHRRNLHDIKGEVKYMNIFLKGGLSSGTITHMLQQFVKSAHAAWSQASTVLTMKISDGH